MSSMPAMRRCAAGLAAALIAALLVTFGGHPGMSGSRPTTGSTHADVQVKPGRLPQSASTTQTAHILPHLDLTATFPVVAPPITVGTTFQAPSAVAAQAGQDPLTATGRAPPAL